MKFVMKNIFILTILCFCSIFSFGENRNTKNVITHVTVTCYQPVKEQCDDNPLITADGSKIDLHKLKQGKIKWCAISRDLLWLFPMLIVCENSQHFLFSIPLTTINTKYLYKKYIILIFAYIK